MDCCICYEKIKGVPPLSCGHYIHHKCIQKWRDTVKFQTYCVSCPLCRQPSLIYPRTRQCTRIHDLEYTALNYISTIATPDVKDKESLIVDFLHYIGRHYDDLERHSISWDYIIEWGILLYETMESA